MAVGADLAAHAGALLWAMGVDVRGERLEALQALLNGRKGKER